MKEDSKQLIEEFIKEVVAKEHQLMATGTILSATQRNAQIARIFDKYINEMGAK